MAEDLNTVTVVVSLANILIAIVSAALFLLVFWQNPKAQANQYFSLTMAGLGLYSIFNIVSRFTPTFNLDPAQMTYITGSLYLVFVVGLFLFSMEFAGLKSSFIRGMTGVVFVAAIISLLITWSGEGNTGVNPVEGQRGSYEAEVTTLGLVSLSITFAFPLLTAVILYQIRKTAPRLRLLWLAPTFAFVGLLWLGFFWRRTYIPLNALFLVGTAAILGWAILRENLFNPLADLSQELKDKNLQLREADYVKNQFLAKMSHELRTPLNSIIGYTDLILDGLYGELNNQQKDRLEKVLRNGRNLLNLINDILDLSRIEVGQITLHTETLSTTDMLESVIGVVEHQAQSKQITLKREFANAANIEADKIRTRQIFTNILSNAVKFTPQGEIRITAQDRGDMVQFAIADTGIGIPSDKVHRVFEEFRQIDNSTTREYGGTGLGMSITKRLVEMSGGKIWLESELGKGTTFYLTLPRAGGDSSGQFAKIRPPSADYLKVLIIDDKHDTQIYMRDSILGFKPKWEVLAAGSGRDGLRMALKHKPHIITLDIMMPSMDGWEVLKRLKADPQLAHIPVIIVSLIDNQALAYQLGAAGILPKPVDRKELVDTLERLGSGEPTPA